MTTATLPYSFLSGRLTIDTLPSNTFSSKTFRSDDARGKVTMMVRGEEYTHAELASFAHAGVRRGFHYHTKLHEVLYVETGRLRLLAKDMGTDECLDTEIESGMLVRVSPRVAHGLIALEPSLVVSIGKGSDPFEDRQPWEVADDLTMPTNRENGS